MANNDNLLHNAIPGVPQKFCILIALSLSTCGAYWLGEIFYCCGWGLITLGGAKMALKCQKKKNERF
jgi:hypothetical protein